MTDDEKWSVRLLVDEETARALTAPGAWERLGAVSYLSVGGWHGDGSEPEPFANFELAADGADSAEQLARSLVSACWELAGLEPRHLDVVLVAPLRSDEASSQRFLEQARDLLEGERYELAIAAAQIHFEIQVRLLMERAADRRGEVWATRLIKNPRAAVLANDVSKATAELLLGIDVTQQSFWPAYLLHLQRRNAVVHEGKMMGKHEAQESINTVQSMWAELAKVERPSTLF